MSLRHPCCASLRSRNAHGHRARKLSHQKGERVETTLNELQALTLPIRTPSVALFAETWPHLGRQDFQARFVPILSGQPIVSTFPSENFGRESGSLKIGVACSAVMMACFQFETKRLKRAMPAGFLSNAQDSQGDGLIHADHQCLPPASEKNATSDPRIGKSDRVTRF